MGRESLTVESCFWMNGLALQQTWDEADVFKYTCSKGSVQRTELKEHGPWWVIVWCSMQFLHGSLSPATGITLYSSGLLHLASGFVITPLPGAQFQVPTRGPRPEAPTTPPQFRFPVGFHRERNNLIPSGAPCLWPSIFSGMSLSIRGECSNSSILTGNIHMVTLI